MMWIDEFIIDEEYRHLGKGKILMDKVKEIAEEKGCKRVELCCWSFNDNALEMYNHIGFKEQRVILKMNV